MSSRIPVPSRNVTVRNTITPPIPSGIPTPPRLQPRTPPQAASAPASRIPTPPARSASQLVRQAPSPPRLTTAQSEDSIESVRPATAPARKDTPSPCSSTTLVGQSSPDQSEMPSQHTDPDLQWPRPPTYHPNYIARHLGTPCNLGSMDHTLTCGHKILTVQPELCAKNCNQPPSGPSHPYSHPNPRSLDESFTCLECIVLQIKAEHAEKVKGFVQAMQPVAQIMGKVSQDPMRDRPTGWVKERLKVIESGWKEIEATRMRELGFVGRPCFAFWVEEEWSELAKEIAEGRCLRGEKAPKRIEMKVAVEKADSVMEVEMTTMSTQAEGTERVARPQRKKPKSRLPLLVR